MKWGVVGCAKIAENAVIPAILSGNESELIAVASRSSIKAQEFAKKFDCKPYGSYEELLADETIESVYIPLPTGLHYEWVMKALENDKHVLVEKSAGVNYTECKSMVELARQKNLALVENFQFQFHSQHKYVKGLISENKLGEIRSFRSSFGFPPFDVESNIRYNRELGGGALLDSGAYVLKVTSFLFGNDFEVASSFLTQHKKFEVDWAGGAFLFSKNQRMFSQVSFGFDNYYQCNYEIWGSEGKLTSTRAFTAKPGFSPTVILEQSGKVEEIILPSDNHFLNMINHFQDIVLRRDFDDDYEKILVQASLIDQVLNKNEMA
ncbi:Gfo/Idh/MocA family oxidoreductase [Saprospiraceae bacterium]|nr:Gfo/Idh/MocA family oxidoreductase [Saprospiraceae bacterium]